MPGPVVYAELQRAEQALREQKEINETFLQVLSDLGHAAIMSDGERIVYANDASAQLFGFSREELFSLPSFLGLVVAEERASVVDWVRQRLTGPGPEPRREFEVLKKDGRRVHVLASADAVRHTDGIRIVMVLVDVSGRQSVEDEKEHALSLLSATLEATSEGVLAVDLQGSVRNFNRQFAEMWQLPRWDLTEEREETLWARLAPQVKDSAAFLARAREAAEGPGLDGTAVLELKDGRVLERRCSTQMVGGSVAGRVWTFRDITHRRRVEETEARLAAIVRSSADGIGSADTKGVITSWNDAMERMLGYRGDEILGKHIRTICPPERAAEQKEIFERVLREGKGLSYETERVRKDGTRVPVAITMSVIQDSSGRVVGTSGVFRNLTEQHRSADAAAQLTREQAARAVAEQQQARFEFLSEVGRTLSSSLDLSSRLLSVTQIAIPKISDWCLLHLVDESGEIRLVAMAHEDPTKVAHFERLHQRLAIDPNAPFGVARVIRTGQSDLVAEIAEDQVPEIALEPADAKPLRELGIRSTMVVPLHGRSHVIGALTFMIAESMRRFGRDDLALAEQFAQRAALAVENSYLFDRQKRAEESLRRLAEIVNSSEDAILSLTLDGIIISWNSGAERLYGYKSREALGQPLSIIVPDSRSGEPRELLARIRRGEAIEHFETVRVAKNGRKIEISISLSPTRDSEGNIVGASSIARDITSRRRDEEALRAYHTQLKQRLQDLQGIYHLTVAASHVNRLDEIYGPVMACLETTLKADRSAILLYDAQGTMRFQAWRNLSDTYRRAVEGHSPWPRDATDPQPVVVPNVEQDASLRPFMGLIQAEGMRAMAFVPLVHQRRLLGKLIVYFNTPHRFTGEETRLAQTIASTVAFTIERHRSHADAERARTALEDFFESSPVGLQWVDPDGRILRANQAGTLGYESHEFIGHLISEFTDDQETMQGLLKRLSDGETVTNQAGRLRTKDGSVRDVLMDASPYKENGEFLYSRLFARDVTEERNAQRALFESKARQDRTLASVPDYVWSATVDPRGRFEYEYCSPVVEQIAGRPSSFFLPGLDKWLGIIHAEDQPRIRRMMHEVVQGDSDFETEEYRIIAPDGKVRWVRDSVRVRKQPDGSIFLDGVVSDITARQEWQEMLQQSEEKFRSFAELSREGFVVMDSEARVTYINAAAQQMFDMAVHDVEGKAFVDLVAGSSRKLFEKAMEPYVRADAVWVIGTTIALKGLRGNGEEFPLEASLNKWGGLGRPFYAVVLRPPGALQPRGEEIVRFRPTT